MKIYTEVIYHWDEAKGELVKESEKSFDYEGPMTLCNPAAIAAAIMAAIQLGTTIYGQWQAQKAQEEQNELDAQKRAQQKSLAIDSYNYKVGQASGAVSQLENVLAPAIDDAETAMVFEAAVVHKRNQGKIKAHGLQNGQSSKFFTARATGDHLRKVEANKDKFTAKRVESIYKKESIISDLEGDYINMEAQIAGLASIGSNDRTAMYMGMINGGLDSLNTYFKYQQYFQTPSTPSTPTPPTPPTGVGNQMEY
jgi:hypothetical protein